MRAFPCKGEGTYANLPLSKGKGLMQSSHISAVQPGPWIPAFAGMTSGEGRNDGWGGSLSWG